MFDFDWALFNVSIIMIMNTLHILTILLVPILPKIKHAFNPVDTVSMINVIFLADKEVLCQRLYFGIELFLVTIIHHVEKRTRPE